MKRLALSMLVWAMAVAGGVWAQDLPPEVYNPQFGLVPQAQPIQGFSQPFSAGVPTQAEIQSIQGAGGFGYNDYAGALFNMPDVFNQFNRDVSSTVALSLMTYNLALPQTAALFQQLNMFGNQRYQQFLMAYPLSAQQQDARNRYLQQCMPAMRDALGAGAGGDPAGLVQANAQAAEACLQRYSVQAREIQLQSNQTYAQFLRDAQDVNKMIEPLLCPPRSGATGSETACWPNLLVKQVRLCGEDQRDDAGRPVACAPEGFGVEDAPITMRAMMDTFTTGLGVSLTEVSINPFLSAIAVADGATLREAAQIATSKMAEPNPALQPPKADVAKLQTEFLGCADPNLMRGLQKLGEGVFAATATAADAEVIEPIGSTVGAERKAALSPLPFGDSAFFFQIRSLLPQVTGDAEKDAQLQSSMSRAMYVAAGCAAGRAIPFLDPTTVVTMRNTCSPDDLQSYFRLAAIDVATVATRNLLTYTLKQLQAAQGRLEANDPLALSSVSSTVDSPVVRQRLATVIKSQMIPQLETDLRHLENIQKLSEQSEIRRATKGIYRNRSGCLSDSAGGVR